MATATKKTKTQAAPAFVLTAQVEQLAERFALAASVCPNRSPAPVLENVLLDARADGVCYLTATNMEVTITLQVGGINVDGGSDFRVLLPAKKFQSILGTLRDDEVQLRFTEKGILGLTSGRTRMQFPTVDAETFPKATLKKPGAMLAVSAAGLASAIARTIYATDTESSRYALGAVSFEAADDMLTAVATDGRRVAVQKLACTGDSEAISENTLLPTQAAITLRKLLASIDGDVQLGSTGNAFFCEADTIAFSSRLVEGRFPRWRDIVPKHNDSFTGFAGELLAAVQQVSLATDDQTVRGATWNIGNDVLSIDAESAEKGSAHSEVVIQSQATGKYTLDCEFMKQYLSKCDPASQIEAKFGDGAMVFKSVEGVYVVMPISKE